MGLLDRLFGPSEHVMPQTNFVYVVRATEIIDGEVDFIRDSLWFKVGAWPSSNEDMAIAFVRFHVGPRYSLQVVGTKKLAKAVPYQSVSPEEPSKITPHDLRGPTGYIWTDTLK